MSGTIVEKLGFEAGDRVAVVHVDDIEMCHAANVGGFERWPPARPPVAP